MASNPAATLTSTLQSASLNRHPSPTHDINPSTSASLKTPVLPPSPTSSSRSQSSSSSISLSALRPAPRRGPNKPSIPPLPDLRFEQSYLASLRDTRTAWDVAWITARDQVLMPLVQGTVWTLMLSGWRYWNRGVMMKGEGVGARVRRWWWGVNNWALPEEAVVGGKGGAGAGGGRLRDEGLARDVGDFYTARFGTAHGD